jgi:hypothetical protein
MLQERERERREGARSAGLMSRQPTRTDIRYQGEGEEGARSAGLMSRQPTRTDIRYQGESGKSGIACVW